MLKPNVLSMWFTRHVECSEDSPTENFQNFRHCETNENVDHTHSVQKNQKISQTCLMMSCLTY